VRDSVLPESSWEFGPEVAEAFDDMLARSIPAYDGMRDIVARIAAEVLGNHPDPRVLDLGSSRGEAIATVDEALGGRGIFTAVEVSDAMLEVLQTRFRSNNRVEILPLDLRTDYPDYELYDLVLSVLTIQFTPIEYRHAILRNIYDSIGPGGGFILVEKVLASNARLDRILTDAYYGLKKENGYSDDQVAAKRRSLEGVLVPLTAAMNEDLLRAAGFRDVEMIWRSGNFAGWVALR
jgi:tRNA (cmo5U34)-methyltransferase